MPPGLNPIHVLVVLVVALIVLGPEKLPEAARTMGKFFNEFRQWSATLQAEARDMLEVATRPEEYGEPQSPDPQPSEPQPSELTTTGTAGADDAPKPVDLNGSAGATDAAHQ